MHILGINFSLGEIAKELGLGAVAAKMVESLGTKTSEAVANRIVKPLEFYREGTFALLIDMGANNANQDEKTASEQIFMAQAQRHRCLPRSYDITRPYIPGDENVFWTNLARIFAYFDPPSKPGLPTPQQARRGQRPPSQADVLRVNIDVWEREATRLDSARRKLFTQLGLRAGVDPEGFDANMEAVNDDWLEQYARRGLLIASAAASSIRQGLPRIAGSIDSGATQVTPYLEQLDNWLQGRWWTR